MTMALSQHWQDFLTAARGGRPERVPVALIVDSPWMPGFAGMHTLDFFLDTDAWLDTYLKVLARFPDVVFLPGFWVEYGMANEPSAFGAGIVWRADSPPSLRHLELVPAEWGRLKRPDPETDGLMPLVLRRLELLEKGGLPEPHRIHFVAARGPLAIAAHVLGTTPFLEATAAEPEATAAALEVFTDTVIAFLRAQLARLREPLGILVLDDLPGMLSPRGFDRDGAALPAADLRRVPRARPHLPQRHPLRAPPAPHRPAPLRGLELQPRDGHRGGAGGGAADGPPRQRGAPRHARARHAGAGLPRGARVCREGRRRAGGFILSAGGGLSPGTPAEHIDALVRAARAG